MLFLVLSVISIKANDLFVIIVVAHLPLNNSGHDDF